MRQRTRNYKTFFFSERERRERLPNGKKMQLEIFLHTWKKIILHQHGNVCKHWPTLEKQGDFCRLCGFEDPRILNRDMQICKSERPQNRDLTGIMLKRYFKV